MSETTFADLGVSTGVCNALAAAGITAPFPIQAAVIADVMAGRDVLAKSPTGSGKTLAFGIPMVERCRAAMGRASGLILVPTRELAGQVAAELRVIGPAKRITIEAVYGGVPQRRQVAAARRADILVATPGRLEDLLSQREIGVDAVKTLVLDEADRMLDMGFQPQVDAIVKRLGAHQTLFFSATLDGAVGKLAARYTNDAARHEVHVEPEDVGNVEHRFFSAERGDKVETLLTELKGERDLTLVFVRTRHGADRLVRDLDRRGVRSLAIHGDKTQAAREKALAAFTSGRERILVATDVAARGIDIDRVSHVINFDAPEDLESYVHRIGRTARAGRTGIGITFVTGENEILMSKIVTTLGLIDEYQEAGFLVRNDSRSNSRRPSPAGGRGRRPARSRATTASR